MVVQHMKITNKRCTAASKREIQNFKIGGRGVALRSYTWAMRHMVSRLLSTTWGLNHMRQILGTQVFSFFASIRKMATAVGIKPMSSGTASQCLGHCSSAREVSGHEHQTNKLCIYRAFHCNLGVALVHKQQNLTWCPFKRNFQVATFLLDALYSHSKWVCFQQTKARQLA